MKPPGEDKDAPIKVLLANKNDQNHMSQVDKETHEAFAKSHKMDAYSGSAKTGDQIN